jgi:hypothetical protein
MEVAWEYPNLDNIQYLITSEQGNHKLISQRLSEKGTQLAIDLWKIWAVLYLIVRVFADLVW